MNTKSLTSQQVCWAQKLSQYYFGIDYYYSKANAAVDALSMFFQRRQNEENELWAENGHLFHHLQNSLTNASLASLSLFALSYLHQVFIYRIYVSPQLQQF